MSLIKKCILSFLAFLIVFHGTATPIMAQSGQWYDSGIYDWYIKVYDTQTSQPQEIFGERYTAAQVQWVLYSLIVVPMNMIFSSEFTACALKNMSSGGGPGIFVCMVIPGFVKVMNNLVDIIKAFITTNQVGVDSFASADEPQGSSLARRMFADRELSGITYFKKLFGKIDLVPEAQAQASAGYGYGALSVLKPLWSKSRDIAYGLLVLAAVIIAFMIMLRTKISPQAVISVQSAIPKLIIAIVLITFSYAIAGFMLDLMYVFIGMAAAILGTGDEASITALYSLMTDGPGGGGMWTMMMLYTYLFPFFLFTSLAGDPSGGIGQLILGNAMGAIAFFVGMIALFIILMLAFLKISFMLIKALVSIYLLTIFAPFYIIVGTITPALSFGQWVKDFISNLAIFPATGIMFVFALLFLNAAGGIIGFDNFPDAIRDRLIELFAILGLPQVIDVTGPNGWAPPLLNFGGNNGAVMILLVSVGVVLLIPKVADIIKGFMSGRPFAYGSGIGEALTAGAAFAGGVNKTGGYLKEKFEKRFPKPKAP